MACKYLGNLSTYDLMGKAASGKSCLDIQYTKCPKQKNPRIVSEYCFRYGVKQ